MSYSKPHLVQMNAPRIPPNFTGIYQHRVAMKPGLQLEHHVPTIPSALVYNLHAHGIRYVMGVTEGWDFSHHFTLRTPEEEKIFLHLCDVLGYRHIEM